MGWVIAPAGIERLGQALSTAGNNFTDDVLVVFGNLDVADDPVVFALGDVDRVLGAGQ